MGITWNQGEQAHATVTTDERLYLTQDKRHLVREDDPRAWFLLAPAGGVIPADEVRRLTDIHGAMPAVLEVGEEPDPKSVGPGLPFGPGISVPEPAQRDDVSTASPASGDDSAEPAQKAVRSGANKMQAPADDKAAEPVEGNTP